MEGDLIKINDWLLPFSWLYGFGVWVRNKLFDMGVLHSQAYAIPVISVGNITVGGTGKTPHVEYLASLLRDVAKVAVLSRGYKRKSKGYILADEGSTPQDIGDEPYQMHCKFPDIYVAVDKNRREGISRLTHDDATKDVDVILLDDAFQHRYVKPGINILLVDYHRLIIYDKLLPAGRLREPKDGKSRADIVIITKCPKDLNPMEIRVLTKAMDLYPYQQLYFTYIDYGEPYHASLGASLKNVDAALENKEDRIKNTDAALKNKEEGIQFTDEDCNQKAQSSKLKAQSLNLKPQSIKPQNVLLLTGIGSPQQMQNDIEGKCRSVTPMAFADHHAFTASDVERINSTFAEMPSPKIIITTEKDAVRLKDLEGLSKDVQDNLYVLPIKVKFMLGEEEMFNRKIISYVRKNSRNSILAKGKDDHTAENSHHSGHGTRTISFRDNL